MVRALRSLGCFVEVNQVGLKGRWGQREILVVRFLVFMGVDRMKS